MQIIPGQNSRIQNSPGQNAFWKGQKVQLLFQKDTLKKEKIKKYGLLVPNPLDAPSKVDCASPSGQEKFRQKQNTVNNQIGTLRKLRKALRLEETSRGL